ncbi:unnamed protein product [Brassicogethes aeneus]|uniref:DUF4817 domain-containing protein n=1 Tax=Brassicogethes aeneus TaxID=1431903 RepID=A0A9P0B7N5_BRAAE|nr:unnamed protein product [Brassicogethes aeneus]
MLLNLASVDLHEEYISSAVIQNGFFHGGIKKINDLIHGEAGRNLDAVVNIYAQRFPEKNRSRTSYHRTVKQFTTNGSVQPKKRVRRATVTGGKNEINVLAATAANPHASTRKLSRDLGIYQSGVSRILKRNK